MSASAPVRSARLVLERDLVAPLLVFFYLYENVENIIRTRKELMRNLVEFMDAPKRVPPEVRDELGIQLPDSESESDSDQGTYRSSSSEDYF